MQLSTIIYWYILVPSVVGALFKLGAWVLEALQIVSWGEWAFATGFIISLFVFRPDKKWETIINSDFKYQVDFPGDPEIGDDYENGCRINRVSNDYDKFGFVLFTIETPAGKTLPSDEVIVQGEIKTLNGRLVETTQYQNGSIVGKCYCIAFVRDKKDSLMHLLIVNNGQFQYHLFLAFEESHKSKLQDYTKKFFGSFVPLSK